jgi:anti-sigma factor RsiW
MSEQYLGHSPRAHPGDEVLLIEASATGFDGEEIDLAASPSIGATAAEIEDARALKRAAKEQLARDLVDIERATAALRRAEPALQSWSQPATQATRPPQPLWVLIGVLWLSAAIVTVGAAVAIVALAG